MIELTEMKKGYDNRFIRLETMSYSPDIHDEPGVYLQHVEGCGYYVLNMTPEQAEALALELLAAVEKTKKVFAERTEAWTSLR